MRRIPRDTAHIVRNLLAALAGALAALVLTGASALAQVPVSDKPRTAQDGQTRAATDETRNSGKRWLSYEEGVTCGVFRNPARTPVDAMQRGEIVNLIRREARAQGVREELALSVAMQESRFSQNVRSCAGAIGVMQLMPGTAKQLGVDPYDLQDNIKGGVKYLRQMLYEFDGNERLAAAAYNAGPNRASLQAGRVPNIPETQTYVREIFGRWEPQFRVLVGSELGPTLAGANQNLVASARAASGSIGGTQALAATRTSAIGRESALVGGQERVQDAWEDNAQARIITAQGFICLDPKQENLKAFGAARLARGDAVFLFAPGAVRSHAWNPLDLVRRGPEMATDCANLAAFLIPEPRGEGAFWASSARNLFAATLGYVLETPLCDNRRHLGSVLALFSTGQDVAAALEIIVKTERGRLSPFIVDQFNQFAAMPEKTRGSVVAHLIDALKPWNNPLIVAATARSDFNLRELRERRMSIFIGAPVAHLESYRPLVRVLIQQVHDQLMRELPETDDAQPVLLLLDEFPTLGRMEALVHKLPVSAGYGIRMAIVVQALSQLDEIYGRPIRDTILANTDLKLFVGTNDQATASYISEALGTRTAIAKTLGGARSQNPFAPRATTRVEVAAPLMRPEQVRELDRKKAILLVRGERPILLDKVVAHRDRWLRRLKRSGRSALLSVPQLQPVRDASSFLGLQRMAPPTPREFGSRPHDPRQHDLPLPDREPAPPDPAAVPTLAEAGADRQSQPDPAPLGLTEPPASPAPALELVAEDAFRAFIAQASADATPERLTKLKESADRFLVLSRKFAGDRAEMAATRRTLTDAG